MSGGRIELHTHLEGSLTPARLIALAERHGRPGLAARCLNDEGTAYEFEGFHGFLDLFRAATSVLRTPDDFREVARDLGAQLARDEVSYAEITVSYGVMIKREINPLAVQRALADVAQEAADSQGVVMRWIPDAVRQWGPDPAWRAWEAAATAGHDLGVVGFGLGGDEAAGPAADFARVFADVRVEQMGVTIHAGEMPSMGESASRSVREAVEVLGADRIGHGVAAAADPILLATLAARGVFIEACPGSNVATGAVASLADHPLRLFLDAGVPCCLNTDDRAFFGVDLAGEYAAAVGVFDLSEAEVAAMHTAASIAIF